MQNCRILCWFSLIFYSPKKLYISHLRNEELRGSIFFKFAINLAMCSIVTGIPPYSASHCCAGVLIFIHALSYSGTVP